MINITEKEKKINLSKIFNYSLLPDNILLQSNKINKCKYFENTINSFDCFNSSFIIIKSNNINTFLSSIDDIFMNLCMLEYFSNCNSEILLN